MDARNVGLGLGIFSIGLGLAELAGTRRIAGALGSNTRGARTTIRAFGAREMLAGAGLLAAPAHSALVWGRVAGDAMDLAALGLAARRSPTRKAVWGAIAFVAGATLVDVLTARRLDRTTAKTFPTSGGDSAPKTPPSNALHGSAPATLHGHATSIEPDDMPLIEAPAVSHH